LKEKQLKFEILDYMQNSLTKDQLKSIVEKLGIQPEELIRKGEVEYKEHFKGKNLTDAEWMDAMLKFPKLIERPVVIKGSRAVIGRPTENILNIL
jgi:arsenate reductase